MMTDFDNTPKHQFLIKKNGLRRYIVSTYLAILIYAVTSLFRDFADITGSDFFKKNIIRSVFSRSVLVENGTSFAYVGQFLS